MSSLKIVLVVIVGLALLTILFRSCSGDTSPSSNDGRNSNESSSQQSNPPEEKKVVEVRPISFGGEYGEIVYLPSQIRFSFWSATEPYCVKDKAGNEYCGKKGQDITSNMPISSDNEELRFKSSNGKTGSIIIKIKE